MKTWADYVVGDKVLAKAVDDLDHPFVIAGKIHAIQLHEGAIKIDWENFGVFTYRPGNAGLFHFYETEAEKLAITLKIL